MERTSANKDHSAPAGDLPVLQMNKVTKMIKGKAIVNQLSFEIRKGEIVGLLGPNGAGKTTTIRLMTGLIRMTEGDVLVHGHSIRDDFQRAIANIGAIIENPEFYAHMTGLDNLKQYVRMSDGIAETRISEVVELVGLQNAMDKKVKAYSLGMRQRLGIAQALLHSPKLLILDEPTNGLDPAGIREMREYMRKIAEVEGISILISSHMLGEIEQICHQAVVIQNGELVRVTALGAQADTEHEVSLTVRVDNLAAAAAVIQSMKGVRLTGTDELHSELMISLHDHNVPELVASFSAAKVGVYRITEHKQSLEDDFLKWTGGNRIA